MNTSTLELIVLCILRDWKGTAIREAGLFHDVQAQSVLAVTHGDLERVLRKLENAKQVFGTTTDDERKWAITANGEVRLAEANR